MKTSWILTVLILLTAAGWHWHAKSSLQSLRREITVVRSSVTAAGLDPVAAARGEVKAAALPPAEAAADLARQKARQDEVKTFAQELIAFALEMKSMEGQRKEPDAATQQRIMAIMERFLDLDEAGLRIVIAELRGTGSLDEKTKSEVIGMSVMMLAQSSPESALRLYAEAKNFVSNQEGMMRHLPGMCLAAWGQKDPAAALAWMKKSENAEYVTDESRRSALAGLAQKDPVMALQALFADTAAGKKENADTGALHMIAAASTPENRRALLDAAAALKPETGLSAEDSAASAKRAEVMKKSILTGISGSLGQGKFEESSAWLETAKLSPEEKDTLIEGVAGSLYGKDPAPWLGWMGANVTDEKKLAGITGRVVPEWTRRDFNAVGTWLNSQPAGPLRNSATKSFVETLTPHEPESAATWALTMPNTPERSLLLESIVEKWTARDGPAAADFAARHNVKPAAAP